MEQMTGLNYAILKAYSTARLPLQMAGCIATIKTCARNADLNARTGKTLKHAERRNE